MFCFYLARTITPGLGRQCGGANLIVCPPWRGRNKIRAADGLAARRALLMDTTAFDKTPNALYQLRLPANGQNRTGGFAY